MLDEPTASLDADSEARVIAALKRLGEGRTLLLLTHRPELLTLCQPLIHLDDGQLVQDRPLPLPTPRGDA